MNEVFKPLVFLVTVGVIDVLLIGSMAGLGLLGWAMWPTAAENARRSLQEALGRSILLGLANVLGSVLVTILLGRLLPGGGRLLALLLILALAACFLVGLPALLSLLGQRVLTLAERLSTAVTACLVGAVLLGAGGLFPWIGQVVLLVALAAALGAGARSLTGRTVSNTTPIPPGS